MSTKKYHIVYKTVNTINGKFYIGKHSTNNLNDGYLGSGKRLRDSIKHYGRNKFKRDILKIFNNEEDAFKYEKEMLTTELLESKMCYNMTDGGKGNSSFGYYDEEENLYYTHANQCQKIMDKVKQTCFKKYGVSSFLETQEAKRKNREQSLNKYGTEYPLQNEDYRNFVRGELMKKVGTRSPIQIPEIYNKMVKTVHDRYGVDNVFYNREVQQKRKLTLEERYGTHILMHIEDVKNKATLSRNQTLMERYGTNSYTKTSEGKKKLKEGIEKRRSAGTLNKHVKNTRWITNGTMNKKIRHDDIVPDGWNLGRTANINKGEQSKNWGTVWITNGEVNIKHPKDRLIPEGFVRGVSHKKTMAP